MLDVIHLPQELIDEKYLLIIAGPAAKLDALPGAFCIAYHSMPYWITLLACSMERP